MSKIQEIEIGSHVRVAGRCYKISRVQIDQQMHSLSELWVEAQEAPEPKEERHDRKSKED